MKRVKIKNENYLSTDSIVHSKKRLSTIINSLLKKDNSVIVAYNNNQINLPAEWNKYVFSNANVTGNKLKLEDGKIVVGKDVKKVKVNASIFLENINKDTTSYIWSRIRKNNVDSCGAICSGVAVYYQTSIISDCVIDVQENDYIELYINNPNTGHIPIVRGGVEQTRLCVEVVE